MIKWLVLVFYCILLFAGTVVILDRVVRQPQSWRTASKLPPNWLLSPDDVAVDVAGRYTAGEIAKNQALANTDTKSQPDIPARPGYLTLSLSVDRSYVQSGRINAGATVRACGAAISLAENLKIAAVICPKAQPQCFALVELPMQSVSTLATHSAAASNLISLRPQDLKCQ
jgi:hypothetical protein